MKNKTKWLDEYNKDLSPYRKTIKQCKFPDIDRGIKNFLANCYKAGLSVLQRLVV